jgi:hypothetical protein
MDELSTRSSHVLLALQAGRQARTQGRDHHCSRVALPVLSPSTPCQSHHMCAASTVPAEPHLDPLTALSSSIKRWKVGLASSLLNSTVLVASPGGT